MKGDRAPDGQPTSSIATMLKYAKTQLDYWVQSKISDTRAIERSTRMVEQQEKEVAELQRWLDIRRAEEASKEQELTGL